MKPGRIALLVGATLLVSGLVSGCSADGGADPSDGFPVVVQQSDNPAIPYGITAIDYHFHDAHPSLPLTPDRTVKFVNDGRVTHNVTFPGLGFSKDLRPGDLIEIEDLGRKLGGPGNYRFFCAFHASAGMVGTIVIASG